jgi:alkylated DNA repair protein alkB family protein 1
MKKAIDFENGVIPDEYRDIVERIECKSYKKVFSIKSHPGLFFIVNPFEPSEQLHWIKKCMDEYPQLPNVTNLDFHYGPVPDIWKNAQHGDSKSIEFLNKLAWATLGYQYAWTERKYVKEKFVEFPKEIAALMRKIANEMGWKSYAPEAAIINYYDVSRCMGGHLDNAEYEMEKPIVSLSFGNSAIFLIGGEDRFSEPIPIIIRSGDVVVMGGRSRYCYHGVPRILEETLPDYLRPENVDEEYKPFCEYMLTKRLNINTRQVYKDEPSLEK